MYGGVWGWSCGLGYSIECIDRYLGKGKMWTSNSIIIKASARKYDRKGDWAIATCN